MSIPFYNMPHSFHNMADGTTGGNDYTRDAKRCVGTAWMVNLIILMCPSLSSRPDSNQQKWYFLKIILDAKGAV